MDFYSQVGVEFAYNIIVCGWMKDSSKMSNRNRDNVPTCPDATLDDTTLMPASDYSHSVQWLEALRTDNVETATAILQAASTKYKEFLMNGDIPTADDNLLDSYHRCPISKDSSMKFCITKPFHAAAIFHSHGVLRLLWRSGVDVLQTDIWQNNVVHMLIFADHMENVRGTKYTETLTYLQTFISEKELKALLSAENIFLLRPLEFAALHGCIGMASVIMHTKNIYLIDEEYVGYNVVQYFDVSDYELFDNGVPPRFFISPLAFVAVAEESRLDNIDFGVVFHNPCLRSWINAKILTNWPFVFIWFVFRICYIGLFLSASLENSWPTFVNNGSDPKANNTREIVICSSQKLDFGSYQWYILSSLSVFILIYDSYNYLFMHKVSHPAMLKIIQGRDFYSHVQFYNGVQFTKFMSVVGITACQLLRSLGFSVPLTLDYMFFVLISFGCMWGVVFFLPVLPWINIYAIAVQRMLFVSIRFMVIFVIFLGVFAISFRRILLGDSNQCPNNFDTMGETMYSSFLVMINSINFREYQNVDKTSLYLLHVVFVFFISILLINFLIAIMTQSFSDLYTKHRTIVQTQRLALMMTVQLQLAWPLQALYRRIQRIVFVYHNKRLCVRRTLIRGMSLDPIWFTVIVHSVYMANRRHWSVEDFKLHVVLFCNQNSYQMCHANSIVISW